MESLPSPSCLITNQSNPVYSAHMKRLLVKAIILLAAVSHSEAQTKLSDDIFKKGTDFTPSWARATPKNDHSTLPTVDWAREVLREKIAEFEGTPIDDYTPMPNVVIQWDSSGLQINGERCWFALFRYEGKNAFLMGHGTTIMQAAAIAEGMITQSAEFTELQRQHAAQFEAQHPQPPMGDIYSKGGYGPGGAPTFTPKPGQLIRSPAIVYPTAFVQTRFWTGQGETDCAER